MRPTAGEAGLEQRRGKEGKGKEKGRGESNLPAPGLKNGATPLERKKHLVE